MQSSSLTTLKFPTRRFKYHHLDYLIYIKTPLVNGVFFLLEMIVRKELAVAGNGERIRQILLISLHLFGPAIAVRESHSACGWRRLTRM